MRLKSFLAAGIAVLTFAAPLTAHPNEAGRDAGAAQPAPGAQSPAPAAQSPAPAAQQAAPRTPPPAQIANIEWKTELGFEPERFRSHVMFLGDDLLEGRAAGTRGHEMAAHYVAQQFAGLGLKPGNDGSWFQQVTLGRSTQAGTARLLVGGQPVAVGESALFMPAYQSQPFAGEAEAVFVGYGIDAPTQGHDDYRGLDVRGKIVVLLPGLPQGLPSDVSAHLGQERARMAANRGAIGMIVLRPPAAATQAPLSRLAGMVSQPNTTWVNSNGRLGAERERIGFTAIGDAPLAEALFAGAPRNWTQVMAEAAAGQRPRGFALRPRVRAERQAQVETFTSPNVVAIIPGSDPALANEYVLLTAHLDGVGVVPEAGDNQPNSANNEGADRIRNGAMDNTTGIATLIEVARHFSQPGNQPRRPILLAAVTAEEIGLLGAGFLAANPVVNGRIIANVNLDMPILTYDFQDVIAFGAEHSEVGQAVQRAAQAMNVGLSADPLPEQGLFTRSDHYQFVKQGVPSVFLMTGFANGGEAKFRGFLGNEYHSIRDDLSQAFDWQAGARFAELNYRIARELANGPSAPRWYQGSFFGDTLGGDQPRAPRPAAAATAAPAGAR